MEKYRFRTSLGWVYISLDLDKFDTCSPGGGGPKNFNRAFEIESGGGFVNNFEAKKEPFLYDGAMDCVLKAEDGSLWAIIELSDGAYGAPEYLLEKCAG